MRSSRLGKSSNCGGQSVLTSAASQTFVVLFRWIAFPPQVGGVWWLGMWYRKLPSSTFSAGNPYSVLHPALPIFHSNTESPLKTHSGGLGELFLDVSVVCISLDRTIPTPGQVSDNSNTSMESARTDTSPPPLKGQGARERIDIAPSASYTPIPRVISTLSGVDDPYPPNYSLQSKRSGIVEIKSHKHGCSIGSSTPNPPIKAPEARSPFPDFFYQGLERRYHSLPRVLPSLNRSFCSRRVTFIPDRPCSLLVIAGTFVTDIPPPVHSMRHDLREIDL